MAGMCSSFALGLHLREGAVVHLIARELIDMSAELASVGDMEEFPLVAGRGDEVRRGGGPDKRGAAPPRDIYIPDLHLDTIKVKTRDFR